MTQPGSTTSDVTVTAGASTPVMLDPVARRRMMLRAIVASTVGTTIEWYDFFLYGIAAALVFPKLFFPQSNAFTGTLLAFSTYFVGFVARPVGGAIFGHFGDRVGRKASLIATLLLMGITTAAVGITPAYDTIAAQWTRLHIQNRPGVDSRRPQPVSQNWTKCADIACNRLRKGRSIK